MIELFDRQALLPRRDPSLWAAGGALLLAVAALGGYTFWLKHQLQRVGQERQQLEARARLQDSQKPVNPALLADLQAQVTALEAAVAAVRPAASALALSPSQWLDRLDALSAPGLALTQVDIDPAGAARISGQATSTQVVNGFVQAWARQDQLASLSARSIELRQDKPTTAATAGGAAATPTTLRFELRVAAPATAATALSTPPSNAASAARAP